MGFASAKCQSLAIQRPCATGFARVSATSYRKRQRRKPSGNTFRLCPRTDGPAKRTPCPQCLRGGFLFPLRLFRPFRDFVVAEATEPRGETARSDAERDEPHLFLLWPLCFLVADWLARDNSRASRRLGPKKRVMPDLAIPGPALSKLDYRVAIWKTRHDLNNDVLEQLCSREAGRLHFD